MSQAFLFPFHFSRKTREGYLQNLQQINQVFDVCVIGGGITGAAIAREAQSRGLSVLLLEKDDFASGTSSRSSKLVHGGVRYLEQFEFALVHESTRERGLLWRNAPELVTPVPFLFPTFQDSRVPLWKLNLGLWLYDLLALYQTPTRHRLYSKSKTLSEEPGLRSDGLRGSIMYWDGETNDAQLTLANIMDAAKRGAAIIPHAEVLSVEPKDSEDCFQINFEDHITKELFRSKARIVVAAPGPWTDVLRERLPIQSPKILKQTRGSHLLFSKEKLPLKHAIVIQHPDDGRVMFSIPWGEHTILGTTDLFDADKPENVVITASEVDYLLRAAEHYFPQHKVTADDVISTWSGLRPLVAPSEGDGSAGEISREHFLKWWDPGIVIMTGGKLTTHREMAEECVDLIFEKCMDGHRELRSNYQPSRTAQFQLRKPTYPKAANGPLSDEDLIGICRTQMPMRLQDILVRRSQIYYTEKNNGLDSIQQFKDLLMQELGWNETVWNQEIVAYKAYLEKNIWIPLRRRR